MSDPAPGAPLNRAVSRLGYRKNVDRLLAEAADEKKGLAKTLTAKDLIVLGVAGIIGAGIFVLIGQGIQATGVNVIPGFIVSALICAVAGYAYAELSSSIPASGSAYAYIYTVLGELPGWLVAWALVLEYAVGAIAVSVGWRNNLLALINQFKDSDPTTDLFSNPDRPWLYWFTHSPFEKVTVALADGTTQVLHGVINVPSVLIVLIVTALLVRGTKESAKFTFVLVVIKVTILMLAIVGGFLAFDAANFKDAVPHVVAGNPDTANLGDQRVLFGIPSWFTAAALMFFAFIGFDSVSTTAEETKDPKKDMPRGILGSLAIVTLLYVLAATALTSASHWTQYIGTSVAATNRAGEPFGYLFEQNHFLEYNGFGYGALLVRFGAIVGTTSVLLVLILGGVRVFFNMSRDGLLPNWLARISKRGTPSAGTLFYGGFTAVFASLLTLGNAVNLVNIGTLFAFFMVILSVWVFRWTRPDIERPFRMPLWTAWRNGRGMPILPLLSIVGMVGIVYMVSRLDRFTLIASVTWAGIGLLIYAFYSIRHSREAHERHVAGGGEVPALTTGVGHSMDLAPNPGGEGGDEVSYLRPTLRGGDVEVLKLEGVGPTFASKLEAAGYYTAFQVRDADAGEIAKAAGVPRAEVVKWQHMAALLPVNGVGPQYAEALVRAGVTSLEDLAGREPEPLAKDVAKLLSSKDVTIVGQPVTPKRASAWIEDANRLLAKKPKAARAPSQAGGAYTHQGYSLYRRTVVNKDGSERPLYFFAKATPKAGSAPSPLPSGYAVGVNEKTGLPYLRKA
jgi:APA family basic amino acid/polyamine antiporter